MKRVLSFMLVVVLFASFVPISVFAEFTGHLGCISQWETKWKSVYINPNSTSSLYDSGCGIFALVNAVGYLTGRRMDVVEVAEWAYQIGGYKPGDGGTLRHKLYPKVQSKYGAQYGIVVDYGSTNEGYWSTSANSKLKQHLENGGVAIANVPGHFIALVGYDRSSNKFHVYDSAPSTKRGTYKGNGDVWLTQSELATGKMDVSWFCLISCSHKYNSCGKCTNCGNIDLSKHSLSAYNNVGKCPTCSHEFDYIATKSTGAAGVYKVSVSGGINYYEKPYSASGTSGTKVPNGAQIEVLYSVKNHYGNTWYRFKYNGQEGFTSKDNVTFVSSIILAQSITCTLTDPTEGQKIVKGAHPVKGTVTSKNYPLQEVKAYLDGSCIATVTLGSAYSLDIRSSAINTNLTFGKLSYGNHTLVIKARDTKHSDLVTVMTRNFVITDSSGNTGSTTCSHSYSSKVTKTATCSTAGVKTYTCTKCGNSYTESIAATGNHVYSSWTTTKAATCTATGTQQRKCSTCSKTETKTVSATGHSYSSTVTKAATCSTAGVRTYTCTKCSNSYTETIAATGNHVYGSWTTTKSATCTTAGTQQRKCNTCSKTETQTIAATGHNYRRAVSIATCSEPEVTTYTCTNCGNSYEEQTGTQTAPHKWDNGVVTTSPTCAKEGVKTYTCSVCKQTKTEKIAKLQTHTYTEWYLTSNAEHERDCKVCGETQHGTHEFYDEWVANEKGHSRLCRICNDEISYSHTPGPKATETEPQVCTTCGYVIKPALGHTHHWEEKLSYNEEGHWYACTGCSEKKDMDHHAFQDSCDELCDICGYVIAVTHCFYDGWEMDEQNHWHTCTCGKVCDFSAHTWENGVCTVCDAKQPSDSEQPDSSDQAEEMEQPGMDEQPEKDRKPSFIERVVDCFVDWFEQMKDPEVIHDLIEAAKQEKVKRDILKDVQESILPDGEYRMMFYEDKIHTIDGVEYAYVDRLEYVELEDSYVRSLKVGDVIDLTDLGLTTIEVINAEIFQEDTIYNIDVYDDHLIRAENGKWRIHWAYEYIWQYVKEHIAIQLASDAEIVDDCYRMLNEKGQARYPDNVAELFELYGKQTGGDLEIMVTIQNGKAVNAVLYYSPVL